MIFLPLCKQGVVLMFFYFFIVYRCTWRLDRFSGVYSYCSPLPWRNKHTVCVALQVRVWYEIIIYTRWVHTWHFKCTWVFSVNPPTIAAKSKPVVKWVLSLKFNKATQFFNIEPFLWFLQWRTNYKPVFSNFSKIHRRNLKKNCEEFFKVKSISIQAICSKI